MEAITREELAGNAFGMLGLGAGATREEVESAVRQLRVLGFVNLPDGAAAEISSDQINALLMKLEDPILRLRERVWADSGAGSDNQIAHAHDAALRTLRDHIEQEEPDASGWAEVVQAFAPLVGSAEYGDLLWAAEEGGDFDKRATREECAAAQRGMTRAVAGAAALQTIRALDFGDVAEAAEVVDVFRGSPMDGLDEAFRILLDRAEDHFRKCGLELQEALRLAWESRDPARMAPCCRDLMEAEAEMTPQVDAIFAAGDERIVRIRGFWAALMNTVAGAYEACRNLTGALEALGRAAMLARGTPAEAHFQERYEKLKAAVGWANGNPHAMPINWSTATKEGGSDLAGPSTRRQRSTGVTTYFPKFNKTAYRPQRQFRKSPLAYLLAYLGAIFLFISLVQGLSGTRNGLPANDPYETSPRFPMLDNVRVTPPPRLKSYPYSFSPAASPLGERPLDLSDYATGGLRSRPATAPTIISTSQGQVNLSRLPPMSPLTGFSSPIVVGRYPTPATAPVDKAPDITVKWGDSPAKQGFAPAPDIFSPGPVIGR